MPLDLYLVRHGETQSNLDRVFQGHMDTLLTSNGEYQAQCVGKWLDGVSFDAIYSSDLARAANTARAIVASRPGADLILDRDLREMNYGVLQGVPITDFASVLAPHGLAEEWGRNAFSARGIAPPGGESLRQLRNRIVRFVARLDATHPADANQRVLVVTHGGVLRVMMTVLLGIPTRTRHQFAFDNCSITRITRDGSESRVEYHNHVCYTNAPVTSTVTSE